MNMVGKGVAKGMNMVGKIEYDSGSPIPGLESPFFGAWASLSFPTGELREEGAYCYRDER